MRRRVLELVRKDDCHRAQFVPLRSKLLMRRCFIDEASGRYYLGAGVGSLAAADGLVVDRMRCRGPLLRCTRRKRHSQTSIYA